MRSVADVHAADADLRRLSQRQLARRRERLHALLRTADGDERAELRSLMEDTDAALRDDDSRRSATG